MNDARSRSFWKAFGPGVLFAGAAVGVSHLVQSTRAGAGYGLALVPAVIIANLVKYPAFRVGPHYAAATGTSLLEGYRKQGRWALAIYALLTVGTMFTVLAAVSVVCAGLLKALLHLSASPIVLSAALIFACATLLALGRYHWLDRINKIVVATLTLSTLVATVLCIPRVDWSHAALFPSRSELDKPAIVFIAGLWGWMPSAIDVAVWQSLWGLARRRDTGHTPSLRDALLDFEIGYWGTAVLALCFLIMGAGVMHKSGVPFASSAGGFAAQVISLYATALGEWARPLIGLAAFAVMFSTTLTVVDGFPRALSVLVLRFYAPEVPGESTSEQSRARITYWLSLGVLSIGAILVLALLLSSLSAMVDLATTLSFLTAPILAWLNHRAITAPEIPEGYRPSGRFRAASLVGVVILAAFALYYLYLRFVQ